MSTPARQLSVPSVPETVSWKRKRQENSIDEIDRALLSKLESLGEKQDGEAAFGDHVAACLWQLNPRQQTIARIEIDKLLMTTVS